MPVIEGIPAVVRRAVQAFPKLDVEGSNPFARFCNFQQNKDL